MKTKTQLAKEAREAGHKLFTATCKKHGPSSPHYVSTQICRQCKTEDNARYHNTESGRAAMARANAKHDAKRNAMRYGNEVDRYVYLLKSEAAGIAYIGSTTTHHSVRRRDHFTLLRNGAHHNPAIREASQSHGHESFTFEVLAEFPGQPVETLRQYEQFYIDEGEIYGLRLVNAKKAAAA